MSSIDPRQELAARLGLAEVPPARFEGVADVVGRLRDNDYLSNESIASVTFLADRLAKPVLVEGPAGTGKTALAQAVAKATGSRLIRLQCYEGLDESKALYEWNYRKQLLRIQAGRAEGSTENWDALEEDIFAEEFLLTRPLLEAIRATEPVVLLIDEIDRVELETEALLLEILSEYQVSIPELGTVTATQIPMVFLTSNGTRELSEALKRRCLYLYVGYPDVERERDIILSRVPGISSALAEQIARVVRSLRSLDLKKSPSVSETLDWARTLVLLGKDEIGEADAVAEDEMLRPDAEDHLAALPDRRIGHREWKAAAAADNGERTFANCRARRACGHDMSPSEPPAPTAVFMIDREPLAWMKATILPTTGSPANSVVTAFTRSSNEP